MSEVLRLAVLIKIILVVVGVGLLGRFWNRSGTRAIDREKAVHSRGIARASAAITKVAIGLFLASVFAYAFAPVFGIAAAQRESIARAGLVVLGAFVVVQFVLGIVQSVADAQGRPHK